MSFKESDLDDNPFAVKYGRPRADLPMDMIMDLHSKGYSCRYIVGELAKMGIKTSKDTVNRRINIFKKE